MIKFILIILDGFGLRKEKEGNAVAQAKTPNLDKMMNNYPLSKIETSGKFVGLPDGIMGNSEVGHMNLGAGRIIKQDLLKYNKNSLSHLYFHGNFKFIYGDARNKKIMKNLIRQNEFIIPLAGLVGAPLCDKFKKDAKRLDMW